MRRRNFLLLSGAAGLTLASGGSGLLWVRHHRRQRRRKRAPKPYDAAPARLDQVDSNASFDVCIVGSGPAGVVLGTELAKAGLRTVILEAGAGPTSVAADTRYALLNRAQVTGDAQYPLTSTRVMAPGGTTAMWTGNCPRYRPIDFELNSYTPAENPWPIGYATLEPYYALAEQTLQVHGDGVRYGIPRSTVLPAARSGNEFLKEILADAGIEAIDTFKSISPSGGPVRVAGDLLPTFLALPAASLLTGITARRFVTSEDDVVNGVLLRSIDGVERTLKARVYVLAAGAIESARRLLLSRSDRYPQGIGNEYDQVGRYFQEHAALKFSGGLAIPRSNSRLHQIARSYQFYESTKKEDVGGIVLAAKLNRESKRAARAEMELDTSFEICSSPDNRVTLSESESDVHGDPISHLHMQFSSKDHSTMNRCRTLAAECYNKLGVGRFRELDVFHWSHHHIGTTRMGTDPKTSVTDADLRVHGTRNLFALTSGVFVTAGAANPTLLIVALAHRLATHLRELLTTGAFNFVA